MTPEIEREYKAALRSLLAKGVALRSHEERSMFTRTDYRASRHIHDGCEWVLPPGTVVREESHYEFAGTDASADLETTIVALDVSCRCGELRGYDVERSITFSEVLEQVLGHPGNKEEML